MEIPALAWECVRVEVAHCFQSSVINLVLLILFVEVRVGDLSVFSGRGGIVGRVHIQVRNLEELSDASFQVFSCI